MQLWGGGVPDDKNYRKILSESIVSPEFPESRKDNDFLNHEEVIWV